MLYHSGYTQIGNYFPSLREQNSCGQSETKILQQPRTAVRENV